MKCGTELRVVVGGTGTEPFAGLESANVTVMLGFSTLGIPS